MAACINSSVCSCSVPVVSLGGLETKGRSFARPCICKGLKFMTIVAEPSDSAKEDASGFAKRMEQVWLISQQPKPVPCTTCQANGEIECPWCKGTGFFILGDNMLCEVPCRNTRCHVCSGRGSVHCEECKGTGYRAKWLEKLERLRGGTHKK